MVEHVMHTFSCHYDAENHYEPIDNGIEDTRLPVLTGAFVVFAAQKVLS